MLTADAFGVLPPIAKLTPSQAMYHFLSGFTAKVAGTEKGMGSEPKPTFSTCFGAPFMPRHPSVYGNLLRRLIAEHNVDCWLVNTGWTGGKYGEGTRMPIKVTRALLDAALCGDLKDQPMRVDPVFGFKVPLTLAGIDPKVMTPRDTWDDPHAYDEAAAKLADMFHQNFAKFVPYVDVEVLRAGPSISAALHLPRPSRRPHTHFYPSFSPLLMADLAAIQAKSELSNKPPPPRAAMTWWGT